MSSNDSSYIVNGVDVSDIRNRNEARVAEKLREMLEQMGNPPLSPQVIRDAFALALNFLPARYKQGGTIVLREPIRESHLREATARALEQVQMQPKR